MKTLLTIRQHDIVPSNHSKVVHKDREAARAVVLGQDDSVFLLFVGKHGYHKLPGGGIEDNESTVQALHRELLEEIGCRVKLIDELGIVVEYRDDDFRTESATYGLHQISYCYLVRQTGDQIAAHMEQDEIDEGLTEVKAKSIDEAIRLLENDRPNNIEGLFIQKRDLAFIREASQRLKALPKAET